MTRRLRQRIGGETRVRIGRFLDDLLDRTTSSDDPVDVRRLLEKHRMGEVYDQVMEEIVWGEAARLTPDEVLLVLRPEGERPLLVERGPSVMVDGNPIPRVRGGALFRQTGSRHGYGLVKVVVKHGELSADHLKVRREDVLRIPEIVRDYEAQRDQRGNRTWIVEREDGARLVVGEGGVEGGAGRLVTVFATKNADRVLSEKKSTPVESQHPRFSPLNEDTAGGAYYRDTRSPQEQIPDREKNLSGDMTLAENTPDVKENFVDFELQRLSDEGRLTPEDLAELAALDRDARRLETLERINMGLVDCIWCNLPICGRLQK